MSRQFPTPLFGRAADADDNIGLQRLGTRRGVFVLGEHMQQLQNLISRLYPGWPPALEGHRVQIHLADDAQRWLHIETDEGGGLDSPVKPRAVHHLHVSGEFTGPDGSPRRPVALLSVFAPTGWVTDEWGSLAFTRECVPFSYVLTAFNPDDDGAASMRRIWTRAPDTGRLIRYRSDLAVGLAMLREWDREIGRRWQP